MKKVLLLMVALPMFLGLMISCSGAKVDAKTLNGKWTIVEAKGNKVENKEKVPFIEFDMTANRLHGNAGCNMFNTAIKLDEKDPSAISFALVISTMMACPDMELEGVVTKALEEVVAVTAGSNADEVKLVDKTGNALIVLKR